jgi:REP element-mobilizing transposase RayT
MSPPLTTPYDQAHHHQKFRMEFLILIMWNNTDTPLAYFISFHTYGTWLHGDQRGSVDRFHNQFGSPRIEPNPRWLQYNEQTLRAKPLILGPKQRLAIKQAIRETCKFRGWSLLAFNIRTNHVHIVVSAAKAGKAVRDAFKANATRKLREEGLWEHQFSPWVRKGSVRSLWNEQSIERR